MPVSIETYPKFKVRVENGFLHFMVTSHQQYTGVIPNQKGLDDVEACEFTNTEKIQSSKICTEDNGNCIHCDMQGISLKNDNQQRYLLSNSQKTAPSHSTKMKRKVDEKI
ncbi:hypothetical protein Trydic_g15680 [Trypoxylus dichotomus]